MGVTLYVGLDDQRRRRNETGTSETAEFLPASSAARLGQGHSSAAADCLTPSRYFLSSLTALHCSWPQVPFWNSRQARARPRSMPADALATAAALKPQRTTARHGRAGQSLANRRPSPPRLFDLDDYLIDGDCDPLRSYASKLGWSKTAFLHRNAPPHAGICRWLAAED